uniref:Uncharacterized protein n=1 Tax=Rhizophora mucronata TaxID=61149 RepID=A0A2P2PHJ6_RHIMU
MLFSTNYLLKNWRSCAV